MNKNPKRMLSAFLALCMMASLFSTAAFAADTEEKTPICGLEEHTHTAECYQTADAAPSCEIQENHIHDETCYQAGDPVLICGLEEGEEHSHTEKCYQPSEAVLICEILEGHIHDENCQPTAEKKLICGLEEHTHTDECYAQQPEVLDEAETHQHEVMRVSANAAVAALADEKPTEPQTAPEDPYQYAVTLIDALSEAYPDLDSVRQDYVQAKEKLAKAEEARKDKDAKADMDKDLERLNKLKEVRSYMDAATKEVADVQGLVSYIPSPVYLSAKDAVNKAYEAYLLLTDAQKTAVGEKAVDRMLAAKEKIEALDKEVDWSTIDYFRSDVEELIALGEITEDNLGKAKELADYLESDMNSMSEGTKAEVAEELPTAQALLERVKAQIAALKALADYDAVDAFYSLYDKLERYSRECYGIGAKKITTDNVSEVRENLTAAYNLLNEMSKITKALIDEWDLYFLGDVKNLLAKYDEAAAEQLVPEINNKIAALPDLTKITSDNRTAVEEIRTQYDLLTKEAKDRITDIAKVHAIELIFKIIDMPAEVGADNLLSAQKLCSDWDALDDAHRVASDEVLTKLEQIRKAVAELSKPAESTGLQKLQEAINNSTGSEEAVEINIDEYLSSENDIFNIPKDETGKGQQTLVIPAGKNIILTGSIALRRTLEGKSASVIKVESGGTLTLKSLQLLGEGVENADSTGSTAIICEGNLIIDKGSKLEGFTARVGGAIHVRNGGNATLQGSIINNKASEEGGGVAVSGNSHFILDGGALKENHASEGGGIYIGARTNNEWNPADMVPDKYVTLNEGEISNNSAQIGGGIYVDGMEAGISHLSLNEVAIRENTAKTGNLGETSGGGVWFCPNGKGQVYSTASGIITQNTKDEAAYGTDFYTQQPGQIHLSTRLPNSKPIKWLDELKNNAEIPNNTFHDWLLKNKAVLRSDIGMESVTSKLAIMGNSAEWGGGIACNGSLIIGQDKDISITVTKDWINDDGTPAASESYANKSVAINLYRIDRNAEEQIDTVTLPLTNNKGEKIWQYTFYDLPANYRYRIQEAGNSEYTTSYVGSTVDEKGCLIAPDKESGEYQSKEFKVTITNRVKPSPNPETASLKVTKLWKAADGADITENLPESITVKVLNGEAEVKDITLNPANNWSETVTDLPTDGDYKVQETSVPGYTVSYGNIQKDGNQYSVVITNTRQDTPTSETGNLVITKTVSGNRSSTQRDFTFTLTLQNADGTRFTTTHPYTHSDGTQGDITNGAVNFELRHGESVTVSGLPAGTRYTVTEDAGDYSPTVSNGSGTISAGQTITAAFDNYRSGGGGGGGGRRPTPDTEIDEPPTPQVYYPGEEPDPNEPDSPEEITIVEEDVPQTYIKTWDPENEEYVYIPEEPTPLAPITPTPTPLARLDTTPRTDDPNHLWFWLGLCFVSILGIGLLKPSKKKDDK